MWNACLADLKIYSRSNCLDFVWEKLPDLWLNALLKKKPLYFICVADESLPGREATIWLTLIASSVWEAPSSVPAYCEVERRPPLLNGLSSLCEGVQACRKMQKEKALCLAMSLWPLSWID